MQRIQIVKDNVVVNVVPFDDTAVLTDSSKVLLSGGDVFHAPDGTTLMKVDGADKFWVLDGGTLKAPAPPAPPEPTPSMIKGECQRRIYSVASPDCQMNMTAYIAAGGATDGDKTAFTHSLAWVMSMRSVCITLVASLDPTFGHDDHWPACPNDVVVLAAKF